ncbi:hypothetical protein RHGRI_038709 [Rhododendron griersonianum]|uniref:PB1 domain-containing protein n=1 Tax=Rhododendron griersonianum TaxID=479676 RepID=A0AAV6HMP5_9ERIC|nr:hypothetical protein RHGRI_038709 [Rhododendron griersonianum]
MFKTPSTIGQITVENVMGSQNPEPNEFQLDSFEDMNFRNTETGSTAEMPSDWEDLLALEEEHFPERNVSGSINLTVEEVKKRLKLELGSFDIKYEDEEGDRIFLACDEDLRYHLQLFSNQVIRLLVVDSDANTLDFC